MIEFDMAGHRFRYVMPVAVSRTGKSGAAKIQAAATLKHIIEARCVEVMRRGALEAFLPDLVLPSGERLGDLLALGETGGGPSAEAGQIVRLLGLPAPEQSEEGVWE